MNESEFWIRLEYRVCGELSGMPEPRVRFLWCDGFTPVEYLLKDPVPRITGRTWIGEGGRYQSEWDFTLLLPRPFVSRDKIDWNSLFPPENVTGWLDLEEDGERRHVKIDPSAAIPSREKGVEAGGTGEWLREVVQTERSYVEIRSEPRGVTYQALLRAAACECSTFSLVWREGLCSGPAADAIAQALAPDLEREERAHRWPGTELLGGEPALVRYYRLSERTLEVLLEAPGLYSWVAPDRPEDLALYHRGGGLWLGSVAHERDAFLGPALSWRSRLLAQVPGLDVRE